MQLALAERDRYKSESAAKSEIIAAQTDQLNALRALLQIQKSISSEWQTAAEARKSALSIDDKLLAKYDLEVATLRADRDAARKANKFWGVAGFAAGVILTLIARPQN